MDDEDKYDEALEEAEDKKALKLLKQICNSEFKSYKKYIAEDKYHDTFGAGDILHSKKWTPEEMCKQFIWAYMIRGAIQDWGLFGEEAVDQKFEDLYYQIAAMNIGTDEFDDKYRPLIIEVENIIRNRNSDKRLDRLYPGVFRRSEYNRPTLVWTVLSSDIGLNYGPFFVEKEEAETFQKEHFSHELSKHPLQRVLITPVKEEWLEQNRIVENEEDD
jgi:hypothetical protein